MHTLGRIGIYVKLDRIPTMRSEILLSALRLSTAGAVTRGLAAADMPLIADVLACVLSGKCTDREEDRLRMAVAKLLMDKPIFSEAWMNDVSTHVAASPDSVHDHAAGERMSILKNLLR